MLVADISSNQFHCVSEDDSFASAFEMLKKNSFNSLLVLDDKGKMVGLLCIQDILKKVVPPEIQENSTLAEAMYHPNFFRDRCHLLKGTKVKDVMRSEFFIAAPETSVMTVAAELLHSQQLVPVCDEERILGVISRSDMKKVLSENLNIRFNN